MSWERGYYYRARKINGRVVREYVGAGMVATLAAQLDDLERDKREHEWAARRALKDELKATEATLKELHELAEVLTRASLLVAGYRQHKRGQWRKQRDHHKQAQ